MGITLVGRHYVRSLSNKQLYFWIGWQPHGKWNWSGDQWPYCQLLQHWYGLHLANSANSFINVVWKNSINKFDNHQDPGYFDNLRETVVENQNNNLSVKLIYFLDYNTIMSSKKNKLIFVGSLIKFAPTSIKPPKIEPPKQPIRC